MRRTHRQPKRVGGKDRAHGHQSGACALRIGQVVLADLFPHGDDDALPAHHGAQAQRQRHGHLHPVGNELGRLVHLALVVLQCGVLRRREGRIVALLHQADGFAGHVHVVAHVGLLLRRNRLEHFIQGYFVVQVLHQLSKRQDRRRLQFLGADIVRHLGAGIRTEDGVLVHMPVKNMPRLL